MAPKLLLNVLALSAGTLLFSESSAKVLASGISAIGRWDILYNGVYLYIAVRTSLHQANANIDAETFLRPLILGIMLLECGQVTPTENVAYWQHLDEPQSVQVTCLKMWSQSSVRSGAMKQFNVTASHLLTDV